MKLAVDEGKLRHDVRKEIVRNSGDTTWVTDAVIRQYTGGQTRDITAPSTPSIRCPSRRSASPWGSAAPVHGPVRLLVGTVRHPAEVPQDERELLRTG